MSQDGGLHIDEKRINKPMASLSTCHLSLWLGWQMLLILVTNFNVPCFKRKTGIDHCPVVFFQNQLVHVATYGNMDEEYKMGDALLGRTTQEKDLGVTFSADMKVSGQCGIAASKGNQIIGLIKRTIMYKEKQLIVPLYKAIDHIWNIVFKHGGRIVKIT